MYPVPQYMPGTNTVGSHGNGPILVLSTYVWGKPLSDFCTTGYFGPIFKI